MTIYLDGSRIAWEPIDEHIQRTLAVGANSSAILYSIKPGYVSEPETHPEEQGNYIVRGTEEWTVGEEGREKTFLCTPGTLLIIEPNERHWARVVGEEEVLVLCFFSPPRPGHRRVT